VWVKEGRCKRTPSEKGYQEGWFGEQPLAYAAKTVRVKGGLVVILKRKGEVRRCKRLYNWPPFMDELSFLNRRYGRSSMRPGGSGESFCPPKRGRKGEHAEKKRFGFPMKKGKKNHALGEGGTQVDSVKLVEKKGVSSSRLREKEKGPKKRGVRTEKKRKRDLSPNNNNGAEAQSSRPE